MVDSPALQNNNGHRDPTIILAGMVLFSALTLWNSSKVNEPTPDSFMISWSWGFLKMGDPASAQTLSEAVLRHEPGNYRAYDLAAYLALLRKEPAVAVNLYKRALEIQPKSHILLFNYAVALGQLGQSDRALEAVNAAIQLREAPEYIFHKALLLGTLGFRNESYALLQELAKPDIALRGVDWRRYSKMARSKLITVPNQK